MGNVKFEKIEIEHRSTKKSKNIWYLGSNLVVERKKMEKNRPYSLLVTRFPPLKFGSARYGIGPKVLAILGFGFGTGPKPK